MLAKIKEIAFGIRKNVDDINKQIKDKESELAFLKTSPPPRQDIIEYFDRRIDLLANGYDAALTANLNLLFSSPLTMDQTTAIWVITAAAPGQQGSLHTIEQAMLALLGNDIKNALRRRLNAMPWPGEVGPPLADRPALIAKSERELQDLAAQLDKVRRDASSAGLII